MRQSPFLIALRDAKKAKALKAAELKRDAEQKESEETPPRRGRPKKSVTGDSDGTDS